MSEDEIDFQINMLDLDESITDGIRKIENDLNTRPEWWQIAIGHKQATDQEYERARIIYKEFLRFYKPDKGYYSGKSFDEILGLFTVAKMQNRIQTKESE